MPSFFIREIYQRSGLSFPTRSGIQKQTVQPWIPASAGMTENGFPNTGRRENNRTEISRKE